MQTLPSNHLGCIWLLHQEEERKNESLSSKAAVWYFSKHFSSPISRSRVSWPIRQEGENYGLFFLFYSFSTTPPLDYHSHPTLKDAPSLSPIWGEHLPIFVNHYWCNKNCNNNILPFIQFPKTKNLCWILLILAAAEVHIFVHVWYLLDDLYLIDNICSSCFKVCSTLCPVFSSWRWQPQPLCSLTSSSPQWPSWSVSSRGSPGGKRPNWRRKCAFGHHSIFDNI